MYRIYKLIVIKYIKIKSRRWNDTEENVVLNAISELSDTVKKFGNQVNGLTSQVEGLNDTVEGMRSDMDGMRLDIDEKFYKLQINFIQKFFDSYCIFFVI